MITFQCTNCGVQLQRATQPYRCPQCGRQAVGLFRVIASGGQPPSAGAPTVPPGMAPPPVATPPQPGVPPAPPGIHVGQPGPAPTPYGAPPPQPASQFAPPGLSPPGVSPPGPGSPAAAPGIPAPQGGVPSAPPPKLPGQPQTLPPAPQPVVPPAPQAPVPPTAAAPMAPMPQAPQQPPAEPAPRQEVEPASPPTVEPAASQPTVQAQQPPAQPTPPPSPQPVVEPQKPTPPAATQGQPAPPPPPKPQTPPKPAPGPSDTRPVRREPPRPTTPPQQTRRSPRPQPKVAVPPKSRPPEPVAAEKERAPKAEKPRPSPPEPQPEPTRPEQFAWALPQRPPQTGAAPLRSAPAVGDAGRVFMHVQGRLVALEEDEGQPRVCWEYVTGSHAPGPVVLAPDGTLRLHCRDGTLHGLSAEGKQIWMPANVGQPLGYAAPVVDQQGNTYVSAYDGGLIKIDAEGRVADRGRYFRSRRKFDAGGIVHHRVLYIGSDDGYMFAVRLDEPQGANLWNHAAEQGYAGWYIHSTPAVGHDETLIVAGCDEHLYGFALSGEQIWRTEMPGQLLASPVIDPRGHVYVGVSQAARGERPRGMLVSVDGNSHHVRWQYEAAGPVESTPVIGDDEVVYFGDNEGVIHAVDFDGTAKWTARVGSPVRSAGTILAAQRLAFGLDNETLVVLKCSSRGLADRGWPKIGRTLGNNP